MATVSSAVARAAQPGRWPENAEVVLDNHTYRPAAEVRFRVAGANGIVTGTRFDVYATVHRLGQRKPLSPRRIVAREFSPTGSAYELAWRVPSNALTGRYSITFEVRAPGSPRILWTSAAVSFAVSRADVSIDRFQTDRRFYAPGDPVSFEFKVANTSPRRWTRLRVEVGEAQYPWIEPPRGVASEPLVAPIQWIDLEPGESKTTTLHSTVNAAADGAVWYTAVVKTEDGSSTLAFRGAASVYARSMRSSVGPVYPPSYLYSDLSRVRVDGYRTFYAADCAKSAWALRRTAFAAHQTAAVEIDVSLARATDRLIFELRTEAGELVDGAEASRDGTRARADLRFGNPGLYRVDVYVSGRNGRRVRKASVEVAANLLPRSLAIVCPHPDDEFLHPAVIRGALENGIPVHVIYLTNGDAGGSERFFGVDYTPAEAIEFGHIRMAEARSATRHLGIPEANIHFLGLPDGFLENIRTEANGADAVFSPMLGVDHSPYNELHQPNLPFHKRAVLNTLTELLAEIEPDTVYVSHPDERHSDHRAAGRLTLEALRTLVQSGRLERLPAIRVDEFYGPSNVAPEPAGYREHQFFASGETMARVQEAYWYYQTQGGNHARGHVLAFADLPRVERHREITDWI